MLLDDLDRTFDIEAEVDAEDVSGLGLDRRRRAVEPKAADNAKGDAAATLAPGAPADLIAAAAKLVAAGYRISRADDGAVGGNEAGTDGGPDELAHAGETIPALSPRELEVLALLAEGAPNKMIARRLDISVHTAKFHVASIIAKLGAVNRTDAIATGIRLGLARV